MTNHLPMIPPDEDSKPVKLKIRTRIYNWIVAKLKESWIYKKYLAICAYLDRSITVRFIKWEMFPIVLSLIIVVLCIGIVYLHVWLTKVIYNEKVISVSSWNYVRVAKAAETEPVFPDIGDCEQYRRVVEKYFGKLTNEALFVASKESSCIADRISPKNTNGSRDYCLMQINQEPLTAQSLEVCVRRAWEKYKDGRVGEDNWSAFYSVCLKENTKENPLPYPVPKYPKVIKNCN